MLILLSTLALADDPWGAPVAELRVEGNRRVEEAAVLAPTRVHIGQSLLPADTRDLIKAVYGTGLFEDVAVEVADSGAGLIVTVVVVENPAIREVVIEGLDKLDEEDLREHIDVAPFSVLSEADALATVRAVEDFARAEGHLLAEVSWRAEPVGEGIIELVLEVTEGPKVVVGEVAIHGNAALPDRKLRRVMQTKVAGPLAFLGDRGVFDRDLLQVDVAQLQQLYMEEGYVDVAVDAPRVYLAPEGGRVSVSIHVDEGPRYQLGHLRVEGAWQPDDPALTAAHAAAILRGEADERGPIARWLSEVPAAPSLRTGDVFSLTGLYGMVDALEAPWRDRGYAFVQVTPLPEPDPSARVIDLTFRVDPGPKVSVRRIDIGGNDPTWDHVLRREIPQDEGTLYDGRALETARRRVERLGFYESVQLATPRADAPDRVDAELRVVERPTGSFNVGLSLMNVDTFGAQGQIAKENFLGLGLGMNASINISKPIQQASGALYDPYLLGTRWTLAVHGRYDRQDYIDDQLQWGGGVALGRYLDPGDDVRLTLDYSLERVELRSPTVHQRRWMGGKLYSDGTRSALGLQLVVDKRDHRLLPTRGLYFSVSSSLSGGIRTGPDEVLNLLGGDLFLLETKANLRLYQPLPIWDDRMILRFNSTVGDIRSTDGQVVPYAWRFRAGGIDSVRGFERQSLGPSLRALGSEDPTRADDRYVIGGEQIWVNNLELETALIPQAGIGVVVFADAGNAFKDPWGGDPLSVRGLRPTVGTGVRWQSPMGLMRFEVGMPLAPYGDERTVVFDIGMGGFF
ncbi:MAG: outer membrane protein assembly factor BamA [Alphaproteobacteria bacterium]|nr:outer membrane protein assembly factor BamA [Alphaproteobacteria bacterium]